MPNNNSYQEVIKAIIKNQQAVIGPLALDLVGNVDGLQVSSDLASISFSGNGKKIVSDLVGQYASLFGKASVEVCKDAVRPLVSKLKEVELPSNLL